MQSHYIFSAKIPAQYLLICPFDIQKNHFFAILATCMSLKIYILPHFLIFLAEIFRICQKYNFIFSFGLSLAHFSAKGRPLAEKWAWLGQKNRKEIITLGREKLYFLQILKISAKNIEKCGRE